MRSKRNLDVVQMAGLCLLLLAMFVPCNASLVPEPGGDTARQVSQEASLEFGHVVAGKIEQPGQVVTYGFEANSSDSVFVGMWASWGWPGISIYAPGGALLCNSSDVGGGEIASCALPVAGRYEVHVYDGFSQANHTGDYTLYMQRLNDPGNCTPLDFGVTSCSSLTFNAERASYVFEADAGDKVLVRMWASWLWPGIRLYAPDGGLLCEYWGIGVGEVASCELPVSGKYMVQAYDCFPQANRTGNYDLYVQRINNPGKSVMVSMGGSAEGEIVSPAQVDTYTFPENGGDLIRIIMQKTPDIPNIWPGLRLYSPDGLILAEGGDPSSVQIEHRPQQSGLFTILAFNSFPTGLTGKYTLQLPMTILSVSECTPNHGGNTGLVTTTIHGTEIMVGAQATLARQGYATIPGEVLEVGADGQTAKVRFDLAGKALGLWNVSITNPDGKSALLENGLRLEEVVPPQLSIAVIGRNRIRVGVPSSYIIEISNGGNVNAYAVPFWISGIPKNATWKLESELGHPNPVDGAPPLDWDNIPIHVETDTEIILPLLIPEIPAGSSRSIELTLKSDVERQIQLRVRADGALYDSIKEDWKECFKCVLAGAIAAVTGDDPCLSSIGDIINNWIVSQFPALLQSDRVQAQVQQWAYLFAKVAIICGLEYALGAEVLVGAAFVISILEGTDCLARCTATLLDTISYLTSIGVVASVDPNLKLGSPGDGSRHFIKPGQCLFYQVLFENLATATASAQEVMIEDQMDLAKFDMATVSMTEIRFGHHSIKVPAGVSEYSAYADLRPEIPLVVKVASTLDSISGLLKVHYISLDPETLSPPEDPLLGFLPPNASPPEGEGSVLFSVATRSDLPLGTEILNTATIGFDRNLPISTPAWLNTLGHQLPGDCDGDVAVTIGEVQKAIAMFLGGRDIDCGVDCDDNGAVSIGELQKVINAFLGLPASC